MRDAAMLQRSGLARGVVILIIVQIMPAGGLFAARDGLNVAT